MLLLGTYPANGIGEAPPGTTKPNLTTWDWYLDFEEGSGTTAANSGALTGLDGTLYAHSGSVPSWQTDADLGGSCLLFNNSTDRNTVRKPQYPANWRPSGAGWSVIMAVKASALGGVGDYPVLYGYGDYVSGSDQNGFEIHLNYNNTGLAVTTRSGTSGAKQTLISHATLGIAADTAFLLGVCVNSSEILQVFIDGVQKGANDSGHQTIGYVGTEYPSIGFSGDPSFFANSVYGFEGKIGWAAGIIGSQAANMLTIAQEAGFA